MALWSALSRRAGRIDDGTRDIAGDPWTGVVDNLLPGYHDGWLVGLVTGMAGAFVLVVLDRAGSRRR